MSTREIVTLQIGHYANFVGTHFWNLQSSSYSNVDKSVKEINFDVTFREGRTLTGEVTYTPRAIFIDLNGSLNSLKNDGVLYSLPTSTRSEWVAGVSVHEISGSQKNDFLLHLDQEEMNSMSNEERGNDEREENSASVKQDSNSHKSNLSFNLDSVVKVWSDYLKPHLHHKTISLLTEQNHADAENFNSFSLGVDSYKRQMLEMEDKLHFFTEECDNLQGFQLLVDAHDGFSGFAGQLYSDYIEEEFNTKSCFVVNTLPSTCKQDAQKCATSMLNMLLCIDSFSSCSGILPLSTEATMLYNSHRHSSNVAFPFLDYDPSLPFHSSAILASAFDNLSLPYRLDDHVSHLGHHIMSLTDNGRKVLGLELSFPFLTKDDSSMFDVLDFHSNQSKRSSCVTYPEFSTLTPGLSKGGNISLQNVTLSGLSDIHIFGSNLEAAKFRYSDEVDLVQDYLYKTFNTHMNNVHLVKSASRFCEPYPHIFQPRLDHSLASKRLRSETTCYPSSVPMVTSLQNNNNTAGHLKDILQVTEKIQKNRIEFYLNETMELDDFNEKVDNFKVLIDSYENCQPDMI